MVRAERLILFVKAPRPGLVKTRLAKAVGDVQACRLYCTLVQQVLRNLARLPGVQLRFTPDGAEPEIRTWVKASWTARPQGSGNLGTRLARAFAEAFAAGGRRVVIIGSDCPAVTARDIRRAWTLLRTADVVLGPAQDGGYWLVGLCRPQPGLFRGIRWGTREVLRQSRDRIEQAGLRLRLLRPLADIDTWEDWRQHVAQSTDLRSRSGLPPQVHGSRFTALRGLDVTA